MSSNQMKITPYSEAEELELMDTRYIRAQAMRQSTRPEPSSAASQKIQPSAQNTNIHLLHNTQAIPAQTAPVYSSGQDSPIPQSAPPQRAHAPHVHHASPPVQGQIPNRASAASTTATSNKHRQETVLTGALLIGFVVLGLLVVVSIMGLFLLNNETNKGLSRPDQALHSSDNGLTSALTSQDQTATRRSVQKIIALEEQNRRMQLELMMLRKKNADMTSALSEIKTLYSALRIDNSWVLVKKDLASAMPMQDTQKPFDPILYSDFPLLSEEEVLSEIQLSILAGGVENALSFKERDQSVVNKSSDMVLAKLTNLPEVAAPTGNSIQGAVANLAPETAGQEVNVATVAVPMGLGSDATEGDILRLPLSKPAVLENLQAQQPMKLASISPLAGFEPDQAPQQPTGPLTGNTARFLAKMKALKSGQLNETITILHIGDSHIASDSFTRGIRRRLQSLYGDAGRGAVIPANAYKYAHADGVSLTASRGWSSANSLRVKSGPYGLSGVRVSTSSTGAKMTLTSKSGMFDWAEVTLYVGPKQGNVTIATQGGSKKISARATKVGSKTVRIEGRSKTLTVTHGGGGATTVLNWASGRNKPGIQYVNFGLSGATASVTKRWSDTLLANDIKRLDPDLIIYGYGTNEGYNDNLNMASYRKLASGFVGKLRAAAPAAAVMFIGPADGARRRSSTISCGGGWYTPKKLGAVRSTLQSMANENAGLFWDWASAMGGRCGAAKWSTQSPRLVAKDRVHLTPKGYDKSAAAFVAFLDGQVKNSLKVVSN